MYIYNDVMIFSRWKEKCSDYENLEDEFRMALQIEADRYNKVILNLTDKS